MKKLSNNKHTKRIKEIKGIIRRITLLWAQDVNRRYSTSVKIRTTTVNGFHFDVVIDGNGYEKKRIVSIELRIYDDNADIARKYFNKLFN